MAVALKVADIIPPRSSYSRTGRMAEAIGGQPSVKLERPKRKKLDLLKLLTLTDISTLSQPASQTADEDGEVLCSSARDHPAAVKRAAHVQAIEKELAFAKALEAIASSGPDAAGQRNGGTDSGGPDAGGNKPAKAKWVSQPQARVPSERAPPVGHYFPRYAVVEPHQPVAFIVKTKSSARAPLRPPTAESDDKAATTTALASSLISGLRSLTQTPQPQHLPEPANFQPRPLPLVAHQRAPSRDTREAAHTASHSPAGTAAFLSKVQRGVLQTPSAVRRASSVPLLREELSNDAHFHPSPNRSNVRFDRQTTREERQRTLLPVNLPNDLAYSPKLAPFQSPAHSFDSAVPREPKKKLPRTSHDVVGVLRPLACSLERFRFAKQGCLVDLNRTTGRDSNASGRQSMSATATISSTMSAELPAAVSPHTRSFRMNKVLGRTSERPKLAQDVLYEPDYSVLDKHMPHVTISGTPDRPHSGLPGCETREIPVGCYQADSELVHRRVVRAVEIGKVVSREQRERVATGHLDQPTTLRTDVDLSVLQPHVGGNPMMATHSSRDRRMRVMSPSTKLLDKLYDWNVDARYPSLRGGSVEFGKQVRREEHAGNVFANSLKRTGSPSPASSPQRAVSVK